MKYQKIWNKILTDGEAVQYEFSIGFRYRVFGLVVWGIISLPFVFFYGLGLLIFLIAFLYYGLYVKAANAYAFTDKRVLIHRGWLSTRLTSVDYGKITDVTVVEGFKDRLLTKTGGLIINTAGTASHEIILNHITSPYEAKKRLDQIRGD